MNGFGRLALGLILTAGLAGCVTPGDLNDGSAVPPNLATPTGSGLALRALPRASRPIDVGVYKFEDQTGQQKPEDNFSRFSKAVTQGGTSMLVDVLSDVGGKRWFNVVEREGLQNLLTERNLIDQSNAAYRGTTRSSLPPLRFAGMLIEGGIVGYDSNIQTGGFGARLLGIGASTQYRLDKVTVTMRAVSVSSGKVLTSVQTEKSVYSVLSKGSVFRYVGTSRLLEVDGGMTSNEPVNLAVRQAIELAVYALVVEGARDGIWSFADRNFQAKIIAKYNAGRALEATGKTATLVEAEG